MKVRLIHLFVIALLPLTSVAQEKDRNGREYYMVKNSWGDTGNYHGTWYMSRNYIAMNTFYIFLNKHALKHMRI